ncbi:Endoglucanase C precursor [compost metagenome]
MLIYEVSQSSPIQAGVTYYWQTTSTGTSLADPVIIPAGSEVSEPFTVTASGFNHYVRAYNGSCWSTLSLQINTNVIINTEAVISTQPANQNAVVGATSTFTVVGAGLPNYQWQVSTNNGATWVNISGATSASYTTSAATLAMNGYRYRVRLGNSCNTVTSNVVTLSVISGPCLSEGFDSTSTPQGWLASSVNWSEYSDGGSFNANNGTLTSPELNKPSRLTFDLRRTNNANAKTLFVKISTTGQNSGFDRTIATYTHANTTNNGLTLIDIDLSDYSTESKVWIRLEKSSSTTAPWRFDNFEVFCAPACIPAAITATPNTGPANTVVTITGTNFDNSTKVKFGTQAASVEFISATKLKAIVPTTADGNIIVDVASDCDSETEFTLIKQDASGCEVLPNGSGNGNAFASDLIFYEVYDENGGTGGIVSIYNGTESTVDLNDYSFYRTGDRGGAYSIYGVLAGNILPGELAVIGVSGSRCGVMTTGNGSINGGFNDKDGFQLRKDSGSTIVDEVLAPDYSGYYLKRVAGSTLPKAVYDATDWTETSVGTGECLPNVATETPALKTVPPVVTTQPSYAVSCELINTSLALTATEGHVGGNAIAYQWYVLAENGTAWAAVANVGVYSGADSATLIISDVEGLNNFQYYCQVRENLATCFTATNATQIKEATNVWSTNVWSNGTPILASKVIIEGNYDTQINGALDVCELTVNPTGTMRVKANNPIKVKKKIVNDNSDANGFVVESDANLIQTDNIANEGIVKVERRVTGMNNDASVAIDYVYWSSPVSGQSIKSFSPNTPASGFQEYRESNDRFVTTADSDFILGKGYAIRAENVLPNGYDKTYNFIGVPNNGDVSTPVLSKSTGADKGYNLVGNPYPSNIDFDEFHALNSSKIYSSAFFWTNNTYTAYQMGSGYKGNNYAVYNITGGVPATYDKINTNYATAPNGKIKVGQAFIVQSKIAGALDFNNSMRVIDDGTFHQKTTAKNRFWLSLTSPNNLVNTILIGYISGATDSYETDFDSELFAVGSDSFYSVLGARKLAIQGKENNFNIEDVVSVGNSFSVNGTYTIALQTPEGIFEENQNIFLKDKLTNKYINLSTENGYTFEATKGTNINRFDIVYKEQIVLGTGQDSKSQFEVYKHNSDYVVKSSKSLGRVEVYDASGRLMMGQTTSEKTLRLDATRLSNGIYIIKAENSGETKTKKILK